MEPVRAAKESQRTRALTSWRADGGTSHDSERQTVREGHSLSAERRGTSHDSERKSSSYGN